MNDKPMPTGHVTAAKMVAYLTTEIPQPKKTPTVSALAKDALRAHINRKK